MVSAENNEYRQTIELFARERINQNISNGLRQHAKILLETMFKNASAEMRIYSGDLDINTYSDPEIVKAAKEFLSKPYSRLLILLQKKQSPGWADKHPLLSSLKSIECQHGSVIVRVASGNYSTNKPNHFAVMDNDAFRYEHNHEKCEAVANFNNPETAKALIDVFDKACQISSESGTSSLFELAQAQ